MKALFLLALAAFPAAAEVPGGHFYFGAGAFWTIPTAKAGSPDLVRPRQDLGLSLDLSWEWKHFMLGIAAELVGPNASEPVQAMISARAGWIFGEGATAPFIAAGLGYAAQTIDPKCAPNEYDCDFRSGTGPAGILEAGVLFLRDQRFGRAALVARWVSPVSLTGNRDTVSGVPLLMLGFRIWL